jgi:hypothetical protein
VVSHNVDELGSDDECKERLTIYLCRVQSLGMCGALSHTLFAPGITERAI